MATKFSQFNNVVPEGTGLTDLVGLQGGANVIFPIDSDFLDAVTDAPNQVANDILYIDGSGATNVAAFINPSQHPNVPERIVLYAEWLDFNPPPSPNTNYFNFAKGTLYNIPYNDVQSNVSTDSTGNTITMNYNGAVGAAGNTTFTIDKAGQYKVGTNFNFFNQDSANSGMSVFAGIYVGGTLVKGIINEIAGNHGKGDINYFGQNTFTVAAGDIMEIKFEFNGGGGPQPFPATTGGIACSICIELIS